MVGDDFGHREGETHDHKHFGVQCTDDSQNSIAIPWKMVDD